MTTYELIRQLVKLDPEGTMPVMLSMRVAKDAVVEANQMVYEACGWPDGFSIERIDKEDAGCLIIEAVDA